MTLEPRNNKQDQEGVSACVPLTIIIRCSESTEQVKHCQQQLLVDGAPRPEFVNSHSELTRQCSRLKEDKCYFLNKKNARMGTTAMNA